MNRTAAALILVAVAAGSAWFVDRYQAMAQRAETAERNEAAARSQLDSTEAGTVTLTQYVDRVRLVEIKGDTIVKEIPRYVTPQADASCTVPTGFVRLHNAAAGGMFGPNPSDADAAPSSVALSAIAGTVTTNYTNCLANSEALTALQELLRKQGAVIIGDDQP